MHSFFPGQETYESVPSGGSVASEGLAQPSLLRRAEHQALYLQFQNRYPMGAIVSELLHVQDGKFIVRVLVQVGGVTLATGLSAAYSPEVAEDQARVRALEVLGVVPTPVVTTQSLQAELISPVSAIPGVSQARLHGSPAASPTDFAEIQRHREPEIATAEDPAFQQPLLDWSAPLADAETRSVDEPFAARSQPSEPKSPQVIPPRSPSHSSVDRSHPSGSGKTKAVKTNAPIDLSDVITQTSIEIKRLRWTEVQGRQHLQKTYGKRSRHELSVAQLHDFLQYLEAQPTPKEVMC